MRVRASRLGVLAISLFAVGCAVPVATGLDEPDANKIVLALERQSIEGTKETDPGNEGKFRVSVARDEVARALSAMRDEALPRPKEPGVLDAVGKGGLVPSEAAEHAELVAGMAGDLERTLEGVDGILLARVHLNLPMQDPLGRDSARPHGSAAVLIEHRGTTPPIGADAVQRLVAGGVGGLAPSDVEVVLVARPAPPAPSADPLGHVGPFVVARGSQRGVVTSLGILIGLVAMLAAVTLFLYTRLTRLRVDLEGARAPKPSRT